MISRFWNCPENFDKWVFRTDVTSSLKKKTSQAHTHTHKGKIMKDKEKQSKVVESIFARINVRRIVIVNLQALMLQRRFSLGKQNQWIWVFKIDEHIFYYHVKQKVLCYEGQSGCGRTKRKTEGTCVRLVRFICLFCFLFFFFFQRWAGKERYYGRDGSPVGGRCNILTGYMQFEKLPKNIKNLFGHRPEQWKREREWERMRVRWNEHKPIDHKYTHVYKNTKTWNGQRAWRTEVHGSLNNGTLLLSYSPCPFVHAYIHKLSTHCFGTLLHIPRYVYTFMHCLCVHIDFRDMLGYSANLCINLYVQLKAWMN